MSSLLDLPAEVLEQICEIVGADFPFNLHSFVLANRRCYTVGGKYRFLRIRINLVNRSRLVRDVAHWERALKAYLALSTVCHLTICGFMPSPESKWTPSGHDEWENDGQPEDELTRMDQQYKDTLPYIMKMQPRRQTDGWKPLVHLLSQLHGLRDVVWACKTPMPTAVLNILHETLPCFKLHVRGFTLPSLHQHPEVPSDVSWTDYALATSRSLNSIVVPVNFHNWCGVEYNEEAVLQMAAGCAPSLTDVHVVYQPLTTKWDDPLKLPLGRPPWQGFYAKDNSDQELNTVAPKQMNLRCWSLFPAIPEYFVRWEKRIVFCNLKTLHLWEVSTETMILVRKHQFTSLKTLALHLGNSFDRHPELASIDKLAALFISEIKSRLESIHISSMLYPYEKAFDAILEHHGKLLRTLSLLSLAGEPTKDPQMTPSRIKQIRANCPYLKDLRLPIVRTKGNHKEVEIYETIGTFHNLKTLKLQLEIGRGKGGSMPDTVIRNTLINAAVDSRLARAIFRRIIKAGASSLERLQLTPNPQFTYPTELESVTWTMARQWECIRVSGAEDRDALGREFGVIVRDMSRRRMFFQISLGLEYEPAALGPFEKVFRELWPAASDCWDRDWYSFPSDVDKCYSI